MNKPQILHMRMVPAGLELVLFGLSKLPYENVAGLILELKEQAEMQTTPQAEMVFDEVEAEFLAESEAGAAD